MHQNLPTLTTVDWLGVFLEKVEDRQILLRCIRNGRAHCTYPKLTLKALPLNAMLTEAKWSLSLSPFT